MQGSPTDRLWRLLYRLAYQALRVWWRLRRPAAEGAGVAAWREGRLLVVRTSYRGELLDLPGGGVARGEAPRDAAARELREETGIDAPPAELVEAARLEFALDGRRVRDTVFEWAPGRDPGTPRADGREVVWAGWLTAAELARVRLAPGLAGYLAEAARRRGGAGDQGIMAPADGRTATPADASTPGPADAPCP